MTLIMYTTLQCNPPEIWQKFAAQTLWHRPTSNHMETPVYPCRISSAGVENILFHCTFNLWWYKDIPQHYSLFLISFSSLRIRLDSGSGVMVMLAWPPGSVVCFPIAMETGICTLYSSNSELISLLFRPWNHKTHCWVVGMKKKQQHNKQDVFVNIMPQAG